MQDRFRAAQSIVVAIAVAVVNQPTGPQKRTKAKNGTYRVVVALVKESLAVDMLGEHIIHVDVGDLRHKDTQPVVQILTRFKLEEICSVFSTCKSFLI